MSPFPTSAKPWLPGAVLLAITVTVSVGIGLVLGLRSWPTYVGLAVSVLLLLGWFERLWVHRVSPPPPRARGKLKVLQGGKAAPYDLEKDNSTDSQRYLM